VLLGLQQRAALPCLDGRGGVHLLDGRGGVPSATSAATRTTAPPFLPSVTSRPAPGCCPSVTSPRAEPPADRGGPSPQPDPPSSGLGTPNRPADVKSARHGADAGV